MIASRSVAASSTMMSASPSTDLLSEASRYWGTTCDPALRRAGRSFRISSMTAVVRVLLVILNLGVVNGRLKHGEQYGCDKRGGSAHTRVLQIEREGQSHQERQPRDGYARPPAVLHRAQDNVALPMEPPGCERVPLRVADVNGQPLAAQLVTLQERQHRCGILGRGSLEPREIVG